MFQLKDRRPFFIAGVWSRDPGGDGSGFAIITTKPNATLAAVPHERMLAILAATPKNNRPDGRGS